MSVECARFCGGCPADRDVLFPEPCPACAKSGSHPYYCSETAAIAQSPIGSAHRDAADDDVWMPNGLMAHHGDYGGDAATCSCKALECVDRVVEHDHHALKHKDSSLSDGALAGIIVGAVVGALALVAVGVLLTKKILAAPKATPTKVHLKDSVVSATSNAVDMTAVSAIPTTVEAVGS